MIWVSVALAGGLDNLPSVVGRGADQPPTYPVPVGDLDGDGLGDLVVGAPSDDTAGHEAGAVYILYDVAGLDPWTPIADAGIVLTGEEPQDNAGRAVAALGDASGDGLVDVAVSAPEASIVNPLIGKIYVLYGGTVDSSGSLGDHPYMQGTERHERVGYRLFAPGDLDQDGRADLMYGTPYPSASGVPGIGYLGLLFGRQGGWPDGLRLQTTMSAQEQSSVADAVWAVLDSETYVGRSATVVPDQTGDDVPDLLIGAPGYDLSGGVAHSGFDTGWFPAPGAVPDTALLDTGGGIDTGAPAAENHHAAGVAYLFPMRDRSSLAGDNVELETDAIGTVHGETAGDYLPWHLVTLDDGAVLLTAPESERGAGIAYVMDSFLGEQHPANAAATFTSGGQGELLGWGAASGHGLDGTRLVLGSPGWNDGVGRVYLVGDTSGSKAVADVADAVLEGCFTGATAGYHVASHPGPDPYGEDRAWFAMSAPGASVYAEKDGAAYVLTAEDLGAVGQGCPAEAEDSFVDADADGWGAEDDCNDDVSWIHPDAPEVCSDGVDDDCDGQVDESCGAVEGGRGCAAASGVGWLLVLGGALALRRRRVFAGVVLAPALLPATVQAAERSVSEHTLATLWGSAAHENLHGPVKSGDFDGDGKPDIAVANYQGIAHYYVAGEVQLLQNAQVAGDVWLEHADVTIYGVSEHDYVGVDLTVLPAGSYENQAAAELYIGANHAGLTENDQGQLLVYREPFSTGGHLPANEADLVLRGALKGDRFGSQTKLVGDLDGDGLDEVAIGAPQHDYAGYSEAAGRVTVVHGALGPVTGTLEINQAASAVIIGRRSHDYAGWRVLGPGDLDGDGLDDLIVGTLGGTPALAGELHVFLGLPPTSGVEGEELTVADAQGAWASDVATDYAGWGLDGGDIDGDGLAEVVVTAPFRESADGRVYLLDGAPEGRTKTQDAVSAVLDQTATAVLEGEPGSGLGYSVAVGPRILVGAPYASKVWVLDSTLQEQDVLVGSGWFGEYVGWVDDFSGDGEDDVVIVGSRLTNDLEEQGAAIIVDGAAVADGSLPTAEEVAVDMDGDGSPADRDCDDADRRRYPEAEEICGDDIDNDCDRVVDEDGCVTSCGVAQVAHFWPVALVMLGLSRRRKLLALPVLAGCAGPELTLDTPSDPLFGEVEVTVSGEGFDHLVLLVDGEAVAGDEGSALEVTWDTTTVDDGEHHLRARGYYGKDESIDVTQTVVVDQVAGDDTAPVVRFARPREGDVFLDDVVTVAVYIEDETPLSDVTLYANGELLANMRPEGPWEVLWDDVPTGDHVLRAEAVDSAGLSSEASVSFSVQIP